MVEKEAKSLHSICRWTFNPGKGGFVPGDQRPEWGEGFDTVAMINLVGREIMPKLPENIELGIELHYDAEVDDVNAQRVADALVDNRLSLAMITPGAHCHYGYGGVASLDPEERKLAEKLGTNTVDLAYGTLRKAWHKDADKAPALIIWNGSFGYDIATVGIKQMYQNLKESIAGLCKYEKGKGGKLYIGFEPKPNEGHPAMLIPTVASALLFWYKVQKEFDVSLEKKGVNKEFGHSEMIGLDHVADTVEELDNEMMMHMHLNSQGYNDGIILGGPGKYDIDHGVRINGMNIAIAGLIQEAGYNRWKGHDMQTRAYDDTEQGIDRVVRSVISWEACGQAAKELDTKALLDLLANRETAKAEDMMRHAVVAAQGYFDKMYK
jgi:xylose isomerase